MQPQYEPARDPERLDAVRRCDILDTSPEGAFDELTFLASQICRAPISLVAIVDENRWWFKSKLGILLDEVQDDFTLCTHTLCGHDVFTIADAGEDTRFSGDPLVCRDPKIRFYAGTPLVTPDGFAVGTLCVMDHLPRTLTSEQVRGLQILGYQGSRLIALRHKDTARLLGSTDRGWARLLSSYDDFVSEALKGFSSRNFALGGIHPLSPAHGRIEPQNDNENQTALRSNLLQQLAPALLQNELTVHFQPKISLQSRKVTGFEALVRWIHPSLGFILPDEFIPLAESSGQIAALTPWVIEQTVARAQTDGWPGRGLQVAVNLSARNLHEATLPERIDSILKKNNFPPASLMLEITESAVMSDFADALDTLNRLREIGVSLSVDDFGTGYSSLAYLKELPLQELKIDRALIANVHRCDRDSAIVKFAVDLAHNLGMTVVGEGVEEVATLRTLAEIGCDGAQGFAVGRPMRPVEVATWLQSH